jgi:hypothetical protein
LLLPHRPLLIFLATAVIQAIAKGAANTKNLNRIMNPWKTLSATAQLGTSTEGWNLATPPAEGTDGIRVFRFKVYFSAPFRTPPVVQLGLTGFDLDQRDSSRLTLTAREITEQGFTAEIATWRETRVYSVAFSWLALGT